MVVVSASRPENRRWRCGVAPLPGSASAAEDDVRCGDGVVTEMGAGLAMAPRFACACDAAELSCTSVARPSPSEARSILSL